MLEHRARGTIGCTEDTLLSHQTEFLGVQTTKRNESHVLCSHTHCVISRTHIASLLEHKWYHCIPHIAHSFDTVFIHSTLELK